MGQEMETQNTRPSIGSVIREAADSLSGEVTAADIADAVMARVKRSDHAHFLRELLISRVASEVGKARSAVMPLRRSVSTKQSLIRDRYWPEFLAQMIALPSGYKRLAEATADDLVVVAELRRSQANDLVVRAQQFEALAGLMRSQGAATLQDLDSEQGELLLAAA